MLDATPSLASRSAVPAVLRVSLFLIAASLALYIPYKYATQLHAITGLYAFAFPLSAALTLAGMGLAIKPEAARGRSGSLRAGFGLIAALWMAVGLLCIPSLAEMVREMPSSGGFAIVHMTTQHVVLSVAILLFAYAPDWMARSLGARPGLEPSRSWGFAAQGRPADAAR